MQFIIMRKAKIFGLVLLVSLASACSSGIIGNASYIDGRHEMNSSSQNAFLGSRVAMDDIITSRVNDLLVANILLRSKWSFTQDVKYRAHWFGLDGIEIEPERAVWNEIILTGKSEKTIKLIAPSSEAVRVKVMVRD